MRKLQKAALLCFAAGGLAAANAGAVAWADPVNEIPNSGCGPRVYSVEQTLDYPTDPYPEWPSYDDCGATEMNASAAGLIGMPGSPFFTTVFQRMMAPAGSSGAGSAPMGYAAPNLPDTSPFADLDNMIEGRNADFAAKAPAAALPPPDPSLVWVRGAGRWGNYDGVDGGPGAKLETGAIFAGIDLPVSSDFRMGIAGGWSDSQFKMDDDSGTLDATAWHASAYATGASGNWRSKAILTYEYYDMSSDRPVPFGLGTETAYADYNADHIEALGEISYVHLFHPNAAIEPYASVGVSWVDVDGFTETVDGADYLSAAGQEETWPYTLIGMRLTGAMDVNGVLVNPMLDLGWRHVFGDTDPSLLYETLDGSSFAVAGMPIAEDSLVVQAGFDAAFTTGWRTSLKYKGDLAETAQQHTLTGGVAVPF